MHQAPAAGCVVRKSRWHLRTVIALWSLGLAVSLTLMYSQTAFSAQALVAVCWVVVGSIAFKSWANSPVGRLQWDGTQWSWSVWADAHAVRLDLLLDFQSAILVALKQNAGNRVWLWLESTPDRRQWVALRRAVVGSQGVSPADAELETHPKAGEGA